MNERLVPRVRVARTLPASPDVLFACFIEAPLLAQWFGPGAVRCTVSQLEARVGGEYRFEFLEPDGERSIVAGVYREIDPPRRISFTWIWEVWKGREPLETLVTVELRPVGGSTEIVVTHDRFPDQASRDEHHLGWSSTLDCLASFVPILGTNAQP